LSDIHVLAVAALPPFLMHPLREAFSVHDRLHATDAAAFAEVAPGALIADAADLAFPNLRAHFAGEPLPSRVPECQ
jgi:hypothetical protein